MIRKETIDKIFEIAVPEIVAKKEISLDTFNFIINAIEFGCKAELIEKLIVTNSWWDSVDTISKFILGQYLKEFPEETTKVVRRFSNSKNMWLNRSILLFQLGYKDKTNAEILFSECKKHSHSKAFFIQKAIGWALREYGKTNPELVKTFVNSTDLKPLSKKEALKNL